LIIAFTFFYSVLVFNPEKMADNIQKRWWYIPWHRPWDETATYLTKTISHLCFRWWIGLWLVGIYSYLLYYLPFIDLITQSLWSMPVIVTWSSVIIIIWVVQDVINKVNAELVTQRYDSI
jgi:preprotein translocase subunit SecY